MSRRFVAVLCGCLLVAALAAGCGSSKKKSSTTSTPASGGTTSTAATGGISVKPKTIGLLDLTRQSPADNQIDITIEQGAKALGWKVKFIDAQADPQKVTKGVTSLLSQGVDGMAIVSVDAPLIRQQLQQAKSKNIPTCALGGGQLPNTLYAGQYQESERKQGEIIGGYIVKKDPNAKIIILKSTTIFAGKERLAGFLDAVKKVPTAKVVSNTEVDLADPVGGTTKAVENGLAGHPDATAVWAVYDTFAAATIQAVKRSGKPAKVYTHFTSEATTKSLRNPSPLEAVADANLNHASAICLDQMLNQFEKNTPMDRTALAKDPLTYTVVDRQNVNTIVPAGQVYAFPVEKTLPPFIKKWAQEFPAK